MRAIHAPARTEWWTLEPPRLGSLARAHVDALEHRACMCQILSKFFVGMQVTGDVRQCHLSVQQVQALPKRLHGGRGSLQWRPRGPGRGNSLSIVSMAHNTTWDEPRGLVDPANDKDACGVGFIGELNKVPTRSCVVNALEMLLRMTHRGACGCEVNSGWPHISTCCKDIEWDICRYFKLRKAHQLI